MLGAYYLHTNGSVQWKSKAVFRGISPAQYFDSSFIVKYWVVPNTLPGGTIQGGKKWIAEVIAEMVELGGKKFDIHRIAVDGFSMPEKVFNVIYNGVMERRN